MLKIKSTLKLVICGILIICNQTNIICQETYVSGFIIDEVSQEKIIGATVEVKNHGSYTNEYGFFRLKATVKDTIINVSAIGYTSLTQNITLIPGENQLNLFLNETSVKIDTISIIHGVKQTYEIGKITMSSIDLEKTIQLGGEADILKSLQLMPGIKNGVEGTSGLLVRGGNFDENLYLLDDVPLYSTSHLFGLVSTFNGENIKNISLYKGAFPARYSGRLSSVVDVSVKDGHKTKWQKEITLGILSSRIAMDGPIISNKWTFSFAARRSLYDLFTSITNKDKSSPKYFFYDGLIKSNYIINKNNELSYFFNQGRDIWKTKFSIKNPNSAESVNNHLNWGNSINQLKWKNRVGNKMFNSMTFYLSNYKFNLTDNNNLIFDSSEFNRKYTYNSQVHDIGLKIKTDYLYNDHHYFRLGVNLIKHSIVPGQVNLSTSNDKVVTLDTLSEDNTSQSLNFGFFIEDEINIGNFKLNPGFHLSYFNAQPNSNYVNFEPRFSMLYKINHKSTIQASYSRMAQYLHVLSSNGLGLPIELWVNSTSNIRPSTSDIYVLGFDHKLNKYSYSIESYYKNLNGMIRYEAGTNYTLIGKGWESKILTNGSGKSYGTEFLFKKHSGKTTGWVSYTLSKTNRKFKSINNGQSFPFKYDRPNEINLVLNYVKNKKYSFSFNWVFSNGNRVTLPKGFYPSVFYNGQTNGTVGISTDLFEIPSTSNYLVDNNSLPIYGPINSDKFPDYHRLDVSMNRKIKTKKFTHQINLSVYNVYNRKNTLYVTHGYENTTLSINPSDYDIRINKAGSLKSVSQFPILPSISYSLKF